MELISAAYFIFLADFQKRLFSDSLNSGQISEEELLAQADAFIETLQSGGQIIADPEIQSTIDGELSDLNSQPGSNNREKTEQLINS